MKDDPKTERFSTSQIASAGIAGAIILIIVIIVVSLIAHA